MSPAAAFSRYFGLSLAAGRLLEALYEAAGEPTTRHDLEDFAGGGPDSVSAAVDEIRIAMDDGAFVRLHGQLEALTPAGMAECERALADGYQQGRAA